MTSKERIMAVIKGEKPDRIPWIPGMNEFFVKRIVGVSSNEPFTLILYAEACEKVGADLFWGFVPVVEEKINNVKVKQEKGEDYIITSYETPKCKLSTKSVTNADAKTTYCTEFLIKGIKDYDVYRYIIEHTEYLPHFEEVEKVKSIVGERGLIGGSVPPTPIMGFIKWHMGLEKVSYELYDHPKEFTELLEIIHNKQRTYYERASDAPVEIFRSGESSSTTLTSPKIFEKYCMSQLNDYAEIIHSKGRLFDTHMCGTLKDILPLIAQINMDTIEPITPPPTGDTSLSLAKQILKNKIVIGGIDSIIFATFSPDKIERYIADLLSSLPNYDRCMLGTEEIPPDAKMENVDAMRMAIEKYGYL